MIKSNRGQLSIFMGITLIIVMSMLAFIINVGLFVKAKINLQNATDAAAFSGAATQARQLTNIAYVNWELRNTYKEWMFKYYVLGQLGLFGDNLSNSKISGNDAVSFLLPSPAATFGKQKLGANFDKYNIPSICIHNNTKSSICATYSVPGIPRFEAIGVAGITEIHEAFVKSLSSAKGEDCSNRSKLNYLVAQAWAYGAGGSAGTPAIAINRPGAWPQALELALRIRNLEMIVNRPPVANITRQNIEQQFRGRGENIGLNERPIKAFWSAYRNLGGGAYKGTEKEELSMNFKLTELAPQSFKVSATPATVSSFLIPSTDFTYPDGTTALEKHYLDLQLMPVNYATMFSTFVSTTGIMDGVETTAGCGVSKTALPVPAYILGFNKNPNVLTYYAVKAESRFIGLFFPITSGDGEKGIKLTAYAAAKPFGGRIGPKLFQYTDAGSALTARDDQVNQRSGAYVNGLKVDTTTSYQPGMPVPSDQKFWVHNKADLVGGIPIGSKTIPFSIPNMVYDFNNEDDLTAQSGGANFIQVIEFLLFENQILNRPTLGLYHSPQIKALKDSIGVVNPGGSMSGDDVLSAIVRARRPTKYDAINYLIPDFHKTLDGNAAPIIQKLGPYSKVGFTYKLFAPLVGSDLLYTKAAQINDVLGAYLKSNEKAVDIYLESLRKVANGILALNTLKNDNTAAAKSIHIYAGSSKPLDLLNDKDCKQDMASKFNYFFNTATTATACGVVPLQALVVKYLDEQSQTTDGIDKKLFYVSSYYDADQDPSSLTRRPVDLMTAYYPGERQGTTQGVAEHPLKLGDAERYSTRRNFYSTKFFHMAKVLNGHRDYVDEPALREQEDKAPLDLLGASSQLENSLNDKDVVNNSYFLDF